jgi:hypothetical protein
VVLVVVPIVVVLMGGASIGGGASGGGVTLPTAPNVQFQNTQSQISDTIQSSQARNNEPIKAYVVNDITTAQEH